MIAARELHRCGGTAHVPEDRVATGCEKSRVWVEMRILNLPHPTPRTPHPPTNPHPTPSPPPTPTPPWFWSPASGQCPCSPAPVFLPGTTEGGPAQGSPGARRGLSTAEDWAGRAAGGRRPSRTRVPLHRGGRGGPGAGEPRRPRARPARPQGRAGRSQRAALRHCPHTAPHCPEAPERQPGPPGHAHPDRKSVRVGKECRSRWSPYH